MRWWPLRTWSRLSGRWVLENDPGAILTTFEAADGAVVVQVSREHQFRRLAEFIGHPEWIHDPRFATRNGWVQHLEAVIRPAVEEWTRSLDKLAVCAKLASAGIPSGPCNKPEDVITDPHLLQRDMLVTFAGSEGQTYIVPGSPVRLSGVEPVADRPSPTLGEHTGEVLHDVLGLDQGEIQRLRHEGVIG